MKGNEMRDVIVDILTWLFVIFIFIVVVGTVNGANFTDGLDGLATSVTIVIASFHGQPLHSTK